MDHSCYRCGQSVIDGKPFCLQCGAPQIRVAMPEIAIPPAGSVSPSDLPIFSSSGPAVPGALNATTLTGGIDWPTAMRSCAIASLIAALIMTLGLMVPLLAALGAGFLGVNLYHRRNPAWSVTPRSGAKVGAVTGAFFFAVSAVFESLAMALFHTGEQVRQKMLEALQQAASRSNDPQVQVAFDRLKTPEGLALMLVLGLVVLFAVSIAAGGLAGALTGGFIGRKNRP
jgi:hypothetical protein